LTVNKGDFPKHVTWAKRAGEFYVGVVVALLQYTCVSGNNDSQKTMRIVLLDNDIARRHGFYSREIKKMLSLLIGQIRERVM